MNQLPKLRSIGVFCGSSPGGDPAYAAASRELGQACARGGIQVVYGGAACGLMGELARATVAAGGTAIGVMPAFLTGIEPPDPRTGEIVMVDSMHERKLEMFRRSDAFIVLPGGFGTLDETFEIITMRQLKQHGKPISFVDIQGYWSPLRELVDAMERNGMVIMAGRDTFRICADVDEALTYSLSYYPTPEAHGV